MDRYQCRYTTPEVSDVRYLASARAPARSSFSSASRACGSHGFNPIEERASSSFCVNAAAAAPLAESPAAIEVAAVTRSPGTVYGLPSTRSSAPGDRTVCGPSGLPSLSSMTRFGGRRSCLPFPNSGDPMRNGSAASHNAESERFIHSARTTVPATRPSHVVQPSATSPLYVVSAHTAKRRYDVSGSGM